MNVSKVKQSLLILGFTACLISVPTEAASSADTFKKPMTPQEFMNQLVGPMYSLVTPFTAEGEVDHDSIRKMIAGALKYDIKVFNMTGGNSKYEWLSYDEIKAVTRTFLEAVGDRGLTITCAHKFWNARAIDYAKYAESLGADAVEVLTPNIPEEDMPAYFQDIADNSRLAIALKNVGLSEKTMRRLLEIDAVVAMKEHRIREYIFLEAKFADRLRVYGGGTTYRFLAAEPYGAKAYFDIYAIIAPWIAKEFWEAYQAGNLKKCYEMVKKYDIPIVDNFSLPFFHGALEYFGLGTRHLRAPLKASTDEEMEKIKTFFESRGLYPRK